MADEMINSYVALDLETTGIGARHEKITEIGMVKVIDGEATDTYHAMVNPHREIPKRIVELTGITDDMVKDAPGIEEILDEVLAFTEDLPLLGHQIIFDYGFLVQAAVNQKRKFEKYGVDRELHRLIPGNACSDYRIMRLNRNNQPGRGGQRGFLYCGEGNATQKGRYVADKLTAHVHVDPTVFMQHLEPGVVRNESPHLCCIGIPRPLTGFEIEVILIPLSQFESRRKSLP